MYSIFLLTLFLVASHGSGPSYPEKVTVAMTLVKHQVANIMIAYDANDQVRLNKLINTGGIHLFPYYFRRLNFINANFPRNDLQVIHAYGTFDENMYALRWHQNLSSPLNYYLYYVGQCELDNCKSW